MTDKEVTTSGAATAAAAEKHEGVTREEAETLGLATTGTAAVQNACGAWCRRCGCAILGPATAVLVRRRPEALSADLLFLRAQRPEQRDGGLVCWHLGDMYDFLNIGFTRTTQKLSGDEALQRFRAEQARGGAAPPERPVRYLTCADCEREVLGFQYLDEPADFYLLADRVLYERPARP